MQIIGIIVAVVAEISTLLGVLLSVYKMIKKQTEKINRITDGIRCQLRTQMMNTYYANRASKTIKEYESENFIKCYYAYKELGGNSFIDEVYDKVMVWEVIQ